MFSLLKSPPKTRTKISHLTTFDMEGGRSSVSFNTDPNLINKKTSIGFTLPPCLAGPNPKDNSIMIPAFHLHPSQSETFLITRGTCLFTLNRTTISVSAGEEIVIPKGDYHRFTNASSTESMSLEAWYDPADLKREERVFRNLCGYLSDHCSGKGGMLENMSILQLSLFAWEAEAMLCAPSKFFPFFRRCESPVDGG
jgi:mannose-6-phosphate isomerase-like protein (cupin superfamily)